jgi:16S rRNA processing protein RimM
MMLNLEPADLPVDAIEIGRILDAWGVKGWFKVLPYSATPEALFSSKRWFLLPAERGPKSFSGSIKLAIQAAKEHAGAVVANSPAITDRDTAEALKGARIYISRASFPTPDTDEYYWVDLIGMTVVNREGIELGRVHELLSTGPQTVLVIQYEEQGKIVERMVPFVAVFIDSVDMSNRQIRVDWQPDY